jgi:hypothetical protein
MLISPEVVFQQAANRAADVYAQAPAYITYQVTTHAVAPSLNQDRTVVRSVAVRSRDDLAILQDLPQGRNTLARSFPMSPTFDALSYFRLEWHVTPHGTLDAYVTDVKPMRYQIDSASQSDVVVTTLRAYRASYAPDSTDAPNGVAHVVMTPFDYVKAQGSNTTLYYTDVWVDNSSGLPVEVRMGGDNGLMLDIRYTIVQSHFVIDRVHYEETIFAPLSIARFHVSADAVYSNYAFPATPPDLRLADPGAPAGPTPFPAGAITPEPRPGS